MIFGPFFWNKYDHKLNLTKPYKNVYLGKVFLTVLIYFLFLKILIKQAKKNHFLAKISVSWATNESNAFVWAKYTFWLSVVFKLQATRKYTHFLIKVYFGSIDDITSFRGPIYNVEKYSTCIGENKFSPLLLARYLIRAMLSKTCKSYQLNDVEVCNKNGDRYFLLNIAML